VEATAPPNTAVYPGTGFWGGGDRPVLVLLLPDCASQWELPDLVSGLRTGFRVVKGNLKYEYIVYAMKFKGNMK
jgi:hypothetical protein